MTRNEALNRIDELALDPTAFIEENRIEDAKRLVKFLPDMALEVLRREWIRPEALERRQVEFFWSRSANIMNPGNRITRLETLGSGRFTVLTGVPHSIEWQVSPTGQAMPNVLALDSDGAEILLKQIILWQVT